MTRRDYPFATGDGDYPPRRSNGSILLGTLLIVAALALIVWTLSGLER